MIPRRRGSIAKLILLVTFLYFMGVKLRWQELLYAENSPRRVDNDNNVAEPLQAEDIRDDIKI